jgi:hypothetical protein
VLSEKEQFAAIEKRLAKVERQENLVNNYVKDGLFTAKTIDPVDTLFQIWLRPNLKWHGRKRSRYRLIWIRRRSKHTVRAAIGSTPGRKKHRRKLNRASARGMRTAAVRAASV